MILGIGSPLEIIIAIVFYMVTFTVVSEYLKPLLKVEGGKALLLTWGVGLIFLLVIGLTRFLVIQPVTVLLFIFITGITNGVYSRWDKLRSFIRSVLKIEV